MLAAAATEAVAMSVAYINPKLHASDLGGPISCRFFVDVQFFGIGLVFPSWVGKLDMFRWVFVLSFSFP